MTFLNVPLAGPQTRLALGGGGLVAQAIRRASLALDPLQAEGRIEVLRLPVPRYAPYYRDAVRFDVASGTVDVATALTVARSGTETDLRLAGLTVGLADVRLRARDGGEEFLSVPSLALRQGALDLGKREVVIGEISTQGGRIAVIRSPEGKLNLAGLVPTGAGPASPAGAPAPAADSPPPPPWRARVEGFALAGYQVAVTDLAPRDPVSLELRDIQITAQGLSNQPEPAQVWLSSRIQRRGALVLEGSLVPAPLSASLGVELKRLDLRPFQPYFTDRV